MTAVVSATATSQNSVRVGFDGSFALGPGARVTLAPRTVPAVSCASEALSPDGTSLVVELDQSMSPGATYELTAVDVTDGAGQPLAANTAELVGYRPHAPPSRHFDLWSMIPRLNRDEDATGDLRLFIACFQELLTLVLAELDGFTDIFDPERCPERYLDLILWDRGSPFSFPMSAPEKRRLAAVLGDVYEWKGTDPGIENTVRFFIGTNAKVIPYIDEALVLGESEIGVDWVLGAGRAFLLYAFDLEVGRVLTDDERAKIRAIVQFMKPAPTRFMRLIEPTVIVPLDDWVLGVSELGHNTALN